MFEHPRIRGATLVEILFAVLIFGITLGFGLPAFDGVLRASRLTATAGALKSITATARMSAITRGRPAVVCPTVDARHCGDGTRWDRWMAFADDDGDDDHDEGERILLVGGPGHPSVTVDSTRGRVRIRFRGDGFASGSNLTLTLCARDRSDRAGLATQLVLSNSGRLRTEEVRDPATVCASPPT